MFDYFYKQFSPLLAQEDCELLPLTKWYDQSIRSVLAKTFWDCCGSMVRYWRPPVAGGQVIVFLVKSQPLTVAVGLHQGVRAVITPFHIIFNCIDRHSRRCHCWKLRDRQFGTVCIFLIFSSLHPSRKEISKVSELALKRLGIMSLHQPKSVYVASEQQYTAASREVDLTPGGIHKWRNTEQGDWYTDR